MVGRIPESAVFGSFKKRIQDLSTTTQDLSRIDGAQYLRIYEKMQALIADLDITVTTLVTGLTYTRAEITESQTAQDEALAAQGTAFAASTWDTSRIVTGVLPPARGGTGAPNAYENDLSSSTRRTAWVTDQGVLGYAPSTRATKRDIEVADLSVEQLLGIEVSLYRYRSAVAREEMAAEFDCVMLPFTAPTEIGVIADDLHAAGLWQFVMYAGRGAGAVPVGVHVELLGLAALRLAQQAFAELDTVKNDIADIRRQIGDQRGTQ